MFRSIRWRLIASYTLLTLLTISIAGFLSLSLVKRYIAQQEEASLRANAQAIAQQASPLLVQSFPFQQAALYDLAQSAGFVGSVRVRILDVEQQTLADSGSESGMNGLVWVVPPPDWGGIQHEIEGSAQPLMVLPSGAPVQAEQLTVSPAQMAELQTLPPNTEFRTIYRVERPWGSEVVFDMHEADLLAVREERVETIRSAAAADVAYPQNAVMVPIGDEFSPVGYVEVSDGPNVGVEAVETMQRAFLGAAGGATAIATMLGLVVSQGLTAPLHSLTLASKRMSAGDLSVRAPAGGSDEFGELAAQFNRMAKQLESSFAALAAERDTLRRFIADASHELRTPITALKTFNELLQGVAWADTPSRIEFLKESETQIERLEWMTSNLLDLSRLDAGLTALDIEPHEAGDLLLSATNAFRMQAQEKNIELVVHNADPALKLRVDQTWVEIALGNLVNNAVKFTPAYGRIELGAEPRGEEWVRLWVQDTGPGIPAAEQARIFERFYRVAGTGTNGSGLGLANVQSVAQAHGGRVWVESEPGMGSRFIMELPR